MKFRHFSQHQTLITTEIHLICLQPNATTKATTKMASNTVLTSKMVIDHYSSLAREDPTSNAEHMRKIAESFGYAPEDLADIPEGANLGVSCGNPLAVASLKAVSLHFSVSLLSLVHFLLSQ